MLSESSQVKANPLCTWRELAGNVVILQTDTHPPITHELNTTGSFVWNKLQSFISFESLLEELLREFNVEEEVARRDLFDILKALEEKKLLCHQN